MFKFKGFVNIPSLMDNSPSVVADFGELSPIAQTFAREKGHYSDVANFPDVSLTSFLSVDASTTPATQVAAGATLQAHVLEMAQYVFDAYDNGQIPGTAAGMVTAIDDAFVQNTGAHYDANLTITNVAVGGIVTGSVHQMPDYISWDVTDVGAGEDHQVRIWFVDDRFRAQYDEFEILVIPPLDPVDDLDAGISSVLTKLQARTTTDLLADIETVKAGYPPTRIRADDLTWHDPNDFTNTLTTTWTTLIYGNAGDQYVHVEQAIKDYIDANTTHVDGLSHWQDSQIYPDLFAASEFYIIPLWEQIAIEWMTQTDGLYSPLTTIEGTLAVVDQFAYGYASGHNALNTQVVPTLYKSLNCLVVGNSNNAGGEVKLGQKYSDYINVSTSSVDFNRMDQVTQGLVQHLAQLLELAEETDENTIMPVGFSKVERNGHLYVVGRYDDTDFVAVTKQAYLAAP